MGVSVIEHSSVILSQRKYCRRLKRDAKIIPKLVEVKRDGEINAQYNNFNQYQAQKNCMFVKLYESAEFDRKT